MKATGIVRRVDDLGRIVIPKDIRQRLNIREGEALEFYISSNPNEAEIILKKYETSDDSFEVRCAEFVHKKRNIIMGVFYTEDRTTVMLSNGGTETVKRNPKDTFNINVAICYAMAKMGYRGDNPTEDR